MGTSTITDIRPSPIAGQWYEGRKRRLEASVDKMLNDVPEMAFDRLIVGLVVPHAGLRYSGPVAANAFRAVQEQDYTRVVIISPMHHPYPGKVLTTDHEAYETPLGIIPVDVEFLADLKNTITLNPVRRDPEHAVEIECPFLQRTLVGDFKLAPLMLRDQSWSMVKTLGETLAKLIAQSGDRTLLVASSDLSHFYTDEQARKLDRLMLERIQEFDPAGVIRLEDEQKAFACGRGAIAAVLVAAKRLGAKTVKLPAYGTSGDVSGDTSRVVGYGAAIIY